MLFVALAFYYRTGRVATVKTTEANCRTIPLSQSRTMKKRKKKKFPHHCSFAPFSRHHACERLYVKQIISARSVLLDLFRCVEPFRCVEFFRCVEKPVLYNVPLDQVGNVKVRKSIGSIYISWHNIILLCTSQCWVGRYIPIYLHVGAVLP